MLENLIKTERLYGYSIDYSKEGMGIVLADSKEDAKEKIIQSYIKHGYPEDSFSNLEVWKISSNAWFSDSPEVLEIC